MKYKAVLYDMDGTVLDTLADLTDAVNHALAEFNMPHRSAEDVRRNLGNGARRLIEGLVPAGTDEAVTARVLAAYMPYYDAHCRIKTAPYDGICALMRRLNAAGVKQAVISNKPDPAVRELAEVFFPGLLELAVGESAAARRKPSPDMVEAAARQMGMALGECVYVGDSEVDIATAKHAKLDCISVTWGFRSAQELLAAGAEQLAANVDELYALLK